VTDQYGRFVIERLPAGEYEMETWHEKLGSKNQRIFVLESAQTSVEVVYRFNVSLRGMGENPSPLGEALRLTVRFSPS